MRTSTYLVAVLLSATALIQSPAWAHAALASAEPASNVILTASPAMVTLHFTEKLEASFSSIKVMDATGQSVTKQKAELDVADPTILHVALPALQVGKYNVQWTAVGHDGHRRTGHYAFTVK